jgi:hypothetical protein
MCGGIVVKIDFVNHKDLGVLGRNVRILQCGELLRARQTSKSIPKTLFGTENWQGCRIQGVFDTFGHHQKIFWISKFNIRANFAAAFGLKTNRRSQFREHCLP